MKKKFLFMLPCIAAVAIATFVGTKTFKSNASDLTSTLLAENLEALSQGGDVGDVEIYATKPTDILTCYKDIVQMGEFESKHDFDPNTNSIVEYRRYKHYYVPDVREGCHKYKNSELKDYYKTCPSEKPTPTDCGGDKPYQPIPSSYWGEWHPIN